MDHSQRVETLIQAFRAKGESTFHLQDGTNHSNTTRSSEYKKKGKGLDFSSFRNILAIDREKMTALAEPRVSMDQLARETIKQGLIPAIVPEFKGITVGGAIQGGGIESSSHLYGQFNDICPQYEVLIGSGEVMSVSPEENSDLYYGIASSYGTLGLILSAEIDLVPARPYVHVVHHRFNDLSRALTFIEEKRGEPVFLEGIIYSPDHILINVGEAISKPLSKESFLSFNHSWSQWYYLQIQERKESWMSLYDYLFRHDLGAFWMGSYFFHKKIITRFWLEKFFNLPEILDKQLRPVSSKRSPPGLLGRLLHGWMMPSQHLFGLYHWGSEKWFGEHFVVQDSYIPKENAEEFIRAVSDQLKIFPLWLCPVKGTDTPQILSSHTRETDFVNIGIYGYPVGYGNGIEATRYIEVLTQSLEGRKMLYSQSYYKTDEFWKIYPKKPYERLRNNYSAEGVFPTITEKVLSREI